MDNWITIKTFTLPSEAAVLRSRLESEGIECYLANELTTQINPLYSNAIGGVQLQVRESDLQKATEILEDGGYLIEEQTKTPEFMLNLESTTSGFPILNKLPPLFRIMILILIIAGVSLSLFVYATLPTTFEKLTENNWCLDYVIYNNKSFLPQSNDFLKLSGAGFCEEKILFAENGTVFLPGFRTPSIMGHWKIDNHLLQISHVDTFDFVYNGIYQLDFSNNTLVLKSDKTTLNCHVEKIRVNLPF